MIEHLQRCSLIKSSQHVFVRNRSCLTNLLVFMEEVTNYLHMVLLAMYLSGLKIGCQTECVSEKKDLGVITSGDHNGCFSEWRDVISGALQGSVLLFIIYINDIDDCVAGKMSKSADDTKIYHTVYSDKDASAFQGRENAF